MATGGACAPAPNRALPAPWHRPLTLTRPLPTVPRRVMACSQSDEEAAPWDESLPLADNLESGLTLVGG